MLTCYDRMKRVKGPKRKGGRVGKWGQNSTRGGFNRYDRWVWEWIGPAVFLCLVSSCMFENVLYFITIWVSTLQYVLVYLDRYDRFYCTSVSTVQYCIYCTGTGYTVLYCTALLMFMLMQGKAVFSHRV